MQDGEIGLEAGQVLRRRANEHVAREQGMPGIGGDETDTDAVLRISAGVQVLGEQDGPLAQPVPHPLGEADEPLDRHLLVDLAPPDLLRDLGVVHDELVLHRTAGVLAGDRHEGALGRKPPFTTLQCLSVKSGGRQVCMDWADGSDAGAGEGDDGHS